MKELCHCVFTHAGSKQYDSKFRPCIICNGPLQYVREENTSLVNPLVSKKEREDTSLVNPLFSKKRKRKYFTCCL